MDHNKRFSRAMEEVFDNLNDMTKGEFVSEMEKYKDDPMTLALYMFGIIT